MKYGNVNGHRREAQPGLSGLCPSCGSRLIPKCGERRIWHWAHHGKRTCDHWWEPETQWHRDWKNYFPEDWQEVIHRAEDGEKHIADVKTEDGRVLEIQYSYIRLEERRAREAFYPKMVWIVNGLRRKRDKSQFIEALDISELVPVALPALLVRSHGCAILKEWADSRVSVLLDFDEPILWHLSPRGPKGWALVTEVLRESFIKACRTGEAFKGGAYSERTRRLVVARDIMVLQQRRRSRRSRRF